MPAPAVVKPVSPFLGREGLSVVDLDTVADAPAMLRSIKETISNSDIGKAEIKIFSENAFRLVECVRNDTELERKVFSRQVLVALRDGHESVALDIIRNVVTTAAKQIRIDPLSPEDREEAAQVIFDRARRIQRKGEWERTLR